MPPPARATQTTLASSPAPLSKAALDPGFQVSNFQESNPQPALRVTRWCSLQFHHSQLEAGRSLTAQCSRAQADAAQHARATAITMGLHQNI